MGVSLRRIITKLNVFKKLFFFLVPLATLFYVGSLQYFNSENSLNSQKNSSHKSSEVNELVLSSYQDPTEYYQTQIQPILNNRCAVCHSCSGSPCQMNLTSYEGFLRGANKHNVYEQERLKSAEPTRLGQDALTLSDWRRKEFFTVYDPQKGITIFSDIVNMKNNSLATKLSTEDSKSCPSTPKEMTNYKILKPEAGMPYGLPALLPEELNKLNSWLSSGAQGPSWENLQKQKMPKGNQLAQIRQWEAFFNTNTKENKLVSRYIYEHLFLADLYFTKRPFEYYKLIRSKTACEVKLTPIATRRPYGDPEGEFYYCFEKTNHSLANQVHIPYPLSEQKLERIKKLFFTPNFRVSVLPDYNENKSSNPFATFGQIPAKARYQFLLDDARYFVNTFIKGPVCSGKTALNSIDEQFYTFFINPESDFFVNDVNFESEMSQYFYLPATYSDGSDTKSVEIPKYYLDMVRERNRYRSHLAVRYQKLRPGGYSLKDLWDGEGVNDNAVLTIMRHMDSASVNKGAVGDLSKTAYVIDYSLFERLVYNLVVGYDVYGDVGHQTLSRVYMDFIRMEAEENFLRFLPPEQRVTLREFWYRDSFLLDAGKKMKKKYPQHNLDVGTQVIFNNANNAQAELIEQILFNYLKPKVRGPVDLINWKSFKTPDTAIQEGQTQRGHAVEVDKLLSEISSIKARELPFSAFFHDVSFLQVRRNNGQHLAYSIIHHREHLNLSWLLLESRRRDIKLDSLSVAPGFIGSYPNYFYSVDERELPQFINHIKQINSKKDFAKLQKQWGIAQDNPHFWSYYDWFKLEAQKLNPIEAGIYNLLRYENEPTENSSSTIDRKLKKLSK